MRLENEQRDGNREDAVTEYFEPSSAEKLPGRHGIVVVRHRTSPLPYEGRPYAPSPFGGEWRASYGAVIASARLVSAPADRRRARSTPALSFRCATPHALRDPMRQRVLEALFRAPGTRRTSAARRPRRHRRRERTLPGRRRDSARRASNWHRSGSRSRLPRAASSDGRLVADRPRRDDSESRAELTIS